MTDPVFVIIVFCEVVVTVDIDIYITMPPVAASPAAS